MRLNYFPELYKITIDTLFEADVAQLTPSPVGWWWGVGGWLAKLHGNKTNLDLLNQMMKKES